MPAEWQCAGIELQRSGAIKYIFYLRASLRVANDRVQLSEVQSIIRSKPDPAFQIAGWYTLKQVTAPEHRQSQLAE